MRVLFVLPRMVSGGVERVTLNLISEFQREGHVCLLGLRQIRGELVNEARSRVDVRELAPGGLHQFVPRLAKLIEQWQPTHVVTAFADVAALTYLAVRLAGGHPRWIHGVHGTHTRVGWRRGAWGWLRRGLDNGIAGFVYRRADAVVAVSDGLRQEVIDGFHIAPGKAVTIYNPVVPEDQLCEVATSRHDATQPFSIVAMGRLSPEKGFDVLIEAMKGVSQPWRLDIWGEGGEQRHLESLVVKYDLQGRVCLRGYTAAPYAVLRSADLFVLPSRHEGLGNALIEAVACQCQVVATDCPHGPREILEGGKLGALVGVDDVEGLARAIRAVQNGSAYVDTAVLLSRAAAFSVSKSSGRWLKVLSQQ